MSSELDQVKEFLHTFEVGIMKLEPGDMILLKCKEPMALAYQDRLADFGRRIWPDHKVVVVPHSVDVEVVTS